ncbi:MAG: Acryloyl-CoA reductase electron transfer subunit gamma [Phycisphaerae bacterium]|nr:Acryloyl-CoA reductase electron transfer subunit gamma [Phycisphaerae bacterium]
MGYNCVVLAKQVPDTHKVTGKAMKDDGTVNRAALPAVFNPEDLNALEMAIQVKERAGGTVTVMTMGLPTACDILRESLYRGADRGILLTDRRCAGSDTLATSYILSCAIRHLGKVDLVFCGRQAIDGDTAQVGPQTAEKLGIPQMTYVEKLLDVTNGHIRARRNLGHGWEVVEGALPMLVTVTEAANDPRPSAARRLMRYKAAQSPAEIARQVSIDMKQADDAARAAETKKRTEALAARGLLLEQWSLDDFPIDFAWVGLDGSPTKVHRVQSIVLTGSGYHEVAPTDDSIRTLIHELIEDHTIG